MSVHPFKQVDVFTKEPFKGNPLAVILEADDLSVEEMQSIATWTNLSETVFVQSSEKGDYRLQIFTPMTELPFAGHPTIGAAYAVREAGIVPTTKSEFVQECKAGFIPLRVKQDGSLLARTPRPKMEPVDFSADLADAFGGVTLIEPMLINTGPTWITARIEQATLLYDLKIDFQKVQSITDRTNNFGVNLYALDENQDVHVRSFAPSDGVPEDPVCGSGNASVGAHIKATGYDTKVGTTYTARQGYALGRDGYIYVQLDEEDVFIGGHCTTVVDGSIKI